MKKDMKQLPCDQANLSRKVTMGRFVVETVNGRLKEFIDCLTGLSSSNYAVSIFITRIKNIPVNLRIFYLGFSTQLFL